MKTLVPADKAAINVGIWLLCYMNILKQEISSTKTYQYTSIDGTSVVDKHCCHIIIMQ